MEYLNDKNRVGQYLDQHKYPSAYPRFPILIRLNYIVNFILTLRNWYVYRALRRLEKKQYKGFSFLDAGCGMGEFSFGIAKRHPDSTIVGIDYTAANIPIATRISQVMKIKNIKYLSVDLTKWKSDVQYDLILCNSTLQFIKDDRQALANMNSMLKLKGTLLVYIPVRYRRYFPWSELIEHKYLQKFFYSYHNDFMMHRYSSSEVIKIIQQQGFNTIKIEFCYGILGTIAFEMYSLLLAGIKTLPLIISILCLIIYVVVLFPLQILLMGLDFIFDKSDGNGLLIVAEKSIITDKE